MTKYKQDTKIQQTQQLISYDIIGSSYSRLNGINGAGHFGAAKYTSDQCNHSTSSLLARHKKQPRSRTTVDNVGQPLQKSRPGGLQPVVQDPAERQQEKQTGDQQQFQGQVEIPPVLSALTSQLAQFGKVSRRSRLAGLKKSLGMLA